MLMRILCVKAESERDFAQPQQFRTLPDRSLENSMYHV